MNCRDFNDQLYEYLDGTLDAETQAAARAHLRGCAGCRRALQQEQTLAEDLRYSFDQATAGLAFRLAAPSQPARHSWIRAAFRAAGRAFRLVWWRSPLAAGAAAGMLALLLLFLGSHGHRRAARPAVSAASGRVLPATCVIDVPLRLTTHLLRQQNNTVVDAVVTRPATAHARFPYPTSRPGG